MLYEEIEVKTYGEEIKKERMLLGMTQREYAKYMSIPYKTLLKLEYSILR